MVTAVILVKTVSHAGRNISRPTESEVLSIGNTSFPSSTGSSSEWGYSYSHTPWFPDPCILSIRSQPHVLALDLKYMLLPKNSVFPAQGVVSKLATQLCFQEVVPMFCQSSRF